MIQCHRTYCKSRGFLLLPKLLIFNCQQLTAFGVIAARSPAGRISGSLHPSARQRLLRARLLLHPPRCRSLHTRLLTLLPLLPHWRVAGHTRAPQRLPGLSVPGVPRGSAGSPAGWASAAAVPLRAPGQPGAGPLSAGAACCNLSWLYSEEERKVTE